MNLEKPRKTISRKALAHKIIGSRVKHTEPNYRHQLYRIIEVCGVGFAWKIYNQMQKIEAQGGMMTADGTRRRTAFGVFCHLATRQMTREELRRFHMSPAKMRAYDAAQKIIKKIRQAIAEAEGPLVIAAPIVEQEVIAEPEIIAAVQPPAPEVVSNKAEPKKQNNGKANKPAANKRRDFAASRQARFQTPVSDSPDGWDDLPPAVSSKLQQLESAANVLRERVQQLESKPAGQQVGLEMARKLLASNEAQIAALLAEHERSSEGVS